MFLYNSDMYETKGMYNYQKSCPNYKKLYKLRYYQFDCYHFCYRYLSLCTLLVIDITVLVIIACVVRSLFVLAVNVSLIVNDYLVDLFAFIMVDLIVSHCCAIDVFALFVIDLVTLIVVANKSISRGIGPGLLRASPGPMCRGHQGVWGVWNVPQLKGRSLPRKCFIFKCTKTCF